MRQLRYSVAASLDGYIAGPTGEYDWIPMDPDIDFAAIYARFGAIVMGRSSYEIYKSAGAPPGLKMPVVVYSRTLPEGERDGLTFAKDAVSHMCELKKTEGKPIWLWGGGVLFSELAQAGLVDAVEVAVMPVILGKGIRLAPEPCPQLKLKLREHKLYPKSGTMLMQYDVVRY